MLSPDPPPALELLPADHTTGLPLVTAWAYLLLQRPVADRALFAVGKGIALRAQPRVCCHGAVVGEATLALDARLAALAASVESRLQVSSAMSEFKSRFV